MWDRRAMAASAVLLLACLAAWGQAWRPAPKDGAVAEVQYILALQDRAGYLGQRERLMRDSRAALAGLASCPASPSDMDLVPDTPEGGPLRVYAFLPETPLPCAVVEGKSEEGAWKWSVRAPSQGETLPPASEARLSMVRAARAAVDTSLGTGIHCYAAVEMEGNDYSLVFAWTETFRNVKADSGQDRHLLGGMVMVGVVPLVEEYAAQDILIVDQETLCWDVSGVKGRSPLGIRSAQDLGEKLPAECDLLRCLDNPELCPRLLRTGRGSYLAGADGSLRKLSEKEEAKVKDLAPGLFPKTFSKNPGLEGLKSHRKYIRPQGGAEPTDQAPKESAPERPSNRWS